jgi:predicted Rdx family selenoprotein
MKPTISIEYCPKCGWMLRAAYIHGARAFDYLYR